MNASRPRGGVLIGLVFTWVFAASPAGVAAAERVVRSADDVRAAAREAAPGDTLVMADGEWRDQAIVFAADGTEHAPITLRPATPGGVTLTGNSTLSLSGSWLVVDGLRVSASPPEGVGHLVRFRTALGEATHSRLTNTAFVRCNPNDPARRYAWVTLYGRGNRVDHCRFEGQNHSGVTVVVALDDEPAEHRIDHNHFLDRPPGNGNGFEAIRVGSSGEARTDAFVTVEENLFERVDGEGEIISNKSSRNTYRRNTFRESVGALTLRHGDDCLVESNVFLQAGKPRSGGVRVVGEGHTVLRNFLADVGRGNRGAIALMAGIPDSPPAGYDQVKRLRIAENVLVNLAAAAIKTDHGLGSGGRELLAEDVLVEGNWVQDARPPVFEGRQGANWTWRDNRLTGGTADEPLPGVLAVEPFLRRGDDGAWEVVEGGPAGLHVPTPLRAEEVGPAWWDHRVAAPPE